MDSVRLKTVSMLIKITLLMLVVYIFGKVCIFVQLYQQKFLDTL
ncbi:hypothetical protein M23134_01881 [Microscilla marina ATCC 23134]|uniref:Uncharacterized protein n=1 Tax=Microscilla marina ATCC 23134 TaxID=313606 RepID=A1ZC50_MICM2|nr:hypothetical protein M23134_01881 [Microscilla marina ATCC 23134]